MGHELWTSPTTGYRRHGTKLENFNSVLGNRILVEDICEPLRSCPAQAEAVPMAETLRNLDFEIAGVREAEGSPILGLVRGVSLTHGKVENHVETIAADATVKANLPVSSLLSVMREHSHVFVEVDGAIACILTRADLNKPMVRVYLFGLISLLEIHMGFWIAHAYPENTWEGNLKESRILSARNVQHERKKSGQDLDLKQCLQFCDKRELIVQSNDLRGQLKLGSKNSSSRFLAAVEDLRNTLAQSQYDLTAKGSWEAVITLTADIQMTVSVSDGLVEDHSLKCSLNYEGALW